MALLLHFFSVVGPIIPTFGCFCTREGMKSGRYVRNGSFHRKSDSRTILRFICVECRQSFSQATFSKYFGQHKRRVNEPLRKLLVSGVSMRRCAKILRIHRITVSRKMRFLAFQARAEQRKFLNRYAVPSQKVMRLQFDDMETFEHTKLKPVSIALAVTMERKILGFEVSTMPAKGHLSTKSIKKYGRRIDGRKKALNRLFHRLKEVVKDDALFESDQNPMYPIVLKSVFPLAKHQTTKGKRGCIVGQGELKKVTWDPLFCLNHTAAMFRANVNRLFRRTWCTTKSKEALRNHLDIYTNFHNQTLTPTIA
jgi:transposase-like protein